MGQVTYLHEYDDPYKILATSIISKCTPMEVQRVLVDDEFIMRMVMKETRQQDFKGDFLDCIVDEILRNKMRMLMMHQLDELGVFFFANLDLPRLREEILNFCEDCWEEKNE